jgi:hypothetical protein
MLVAGLPSAARGDHESFEEERATMLATWIGVAIVGLGPLLGMAIGRSIRRGRAAGPTGQDRPKDPSVKANILVVVIGIVVTGIIETVFSDWVSFVILVAITAVCFALAIRRHRRYRAHS